MKYLYQIVDSSKGKAELHVYTSQEAALRTFRHEYKQPKVFPSRWFTASVTLPHVDVDLDHGDWCDACVLYASSAERSKDQDGARGEHLPWLVRYLAKYAEKSA